MQEVTLSAGTIRYRDEGTGPTLLFIHGVFMNHLAWRKVVPSLVAEFRCITPGLALGVAHHPDGRRCRPQPARRGPDHPRVHRDSRTERRHRGRQRHRRSAFPTADIRK